MTSGVVGFVGFGLYLLLFLIIQFLIGSSAGVRGIQRGDVVTRFLMMAMWLAIVSGVADVVLLVITVFFRNRFEAIGTGLTVQDIAICVGIFALALYFRWLSQKEQA